MQQLCDMVEVDATALVEHDGERISRTGDHGAAGGQSPAR